MYVLVLALAIAAHDQRAPVMELPRLEGRWFSDGGTEMLIKGDTVRVGGRDGVNYFSGKLLLNAATDRFAIVEDKLVTEYRYRLDGNILRLTFFCGEVETYQRVRIGGAAK